MKVLVGSTNPVKVQAVKEAFSKFFEDVEVKGRKVNSGVPDQPFDDDTFKGARNRARALMDEEADFYVGLEGGVTELLGRTFTFGAFCIIDRAGRESFGASPLLLLPSRVVEGLREGKELGDVMDELTGEHNTKQKGGASGFFTNGVVPRKDFYLQGLCVAMAPFLHEGLYEEK